MVMEDKVGKDYAKTDLPNTSFKMSILLSQGGGKRRHSKVDIKTYSG